MIEKLNFDDGLKRLYPLMMDRASCSFEEMKSSLEGGEIYDCSGALVYVRGPEVHAIVPDSLRGLWMSKAVIKEILGSIISKYGYAQTSATTELGKRFVSRLGFKQEGSCWILRCKDGT